MAALVIPNNVPFGQMTSQVVSRLVGLNASVPRLQEAIATAASGFTGTPGTEYEAPLMGNGANIALVNNFGVQPDPDNPGAQGTAYAYAVEQLENAWRDFWTAAAPYVEQLDNGTAGF